MVEQMILLVEDNPDDAMLAVRAFNRNQLEVNVDVVSDGVEALDYLYCEGEYSNRDCTKQPNIILLDLNLPKLNGLEVLKSIRKDKRTTLLPVIILTSSVEERDVVNCYDSGANSYVHKPIDFDQFSNMSNQLLDYWFSTNITPPVQCEF